MKNKRSLILLAGVFAAVASVVALLLAPVLEHWRTESPDGTFVAIVHTQPFRSFIPAMPGGGSDKPGRVTVYRGGQSYGSAWLPMVSFVYDLRWELERQPRRAESRLAATWNLDDCRIESVFGG